MTGLLPDETTVGRVALRVTDLDRMVTFYERVVGLAVLDRGPDGATLGVDGTALLEFRHDPAAGERSSSATGLFHTAFLVPSRQHLADALARIERYTSLSGASDHLVSEALYLTDPEDNGIEVYRDRPRGEWPMDGDRVEMDTLPLDLTSLRDGSRVVDSAPAGTTVGHVHLEVSSIERSSAFYVDTLGFRVRQTFGSSALFVAADEYHHHVGLNVWNGRTDPPTGRGLDWFELIVPDEATLDSFRDRLRESDVDVTMRDGAVEVSDPDGIRLRLRHGAPFETS